MFFHPCHSPYPLSSLIFKSPSPLLPRQDFHRKVPSISATVFQIKLTIFESGKFYGQNLLPSNADFRKHLTSRRKKTVFFRVRGAFENCLRFDVRILKFYSSSGSSHSDIIPELFCAVENNTRRPNLQAFNQK